MPMTKVKCDEHSLYVRTDGRVYRPYKAKFSGSAPGAINDGMSKLCPVLEVKVNHLRGTTYCKVMALGYPDEYWHSHGEYLGKKSFECWRPV